jgi:adenylosuccinate synthase
MTVVAVIGCGWGDEGKGKIVDALAAERGARLVIRFNGGPNAGHTVVPETEDSPLPAWNRAVFRLHQVPSGVFTPDCVSLCGPGTVIDPDGFLSEIEEVQAQGVDTERLFLSDRAHIVFPYHRERDGLIEAARAQFKQGTTLRGVGPAYEDKMARIGLRLGDLLDGDYLDEYLPFLAREQSRRLAVYGGGAVDPTQLRDLCERWGQALRHRIVDSYPLVRDALRSEETVILEGQLGAMKDIDWGIYPYVTSSAATAAAGAATAGVPPAAVREVIGVVKAFATTVGGGPLITEQFDQTAEFLRTAGESETEQEFGATTGRPRRCGWFDAVAARQAAAINGCTGLALTKLDTLDNLIEVPVATAYRLDGQEIDYVPSSTRLQERATAVYETLPGWGQPARDVRRWEDLPAEARAYAERIEVLTGVPVAYAGTGPSRLALARRAG